MLPAHVVLTEMVIDPICSIAFEGTPGEPDLMRRPPRDPQEPLIGLAQLALAFLQGALLLGATFGLYAVALARGAPDGEARALAFVALTAGNLMLVRVNATRSATLPRLLDAGHRPFWVVASVATAVVVACLVVPGLAALFRFEVPDAASLAGAALLGAASALAFDALKRVPHVRRLLSTTPIGAVGGVSTVQVGDRS
jgi:Ca2+-transporting ATPase